MGRINIPETKSGKAENGGCIRKVIGEWFVIFCCGREQKPDRILRLLPDFTYRERVLEIIVCKNCGRMTGELSQYNVKTKKCEKKRLKKRQLAKYVQRLENGRLQEKEIPKGTKGGAGFVYGVNIADKEGNIHQYSVDFNGVKTYIKTIKQENKEKDD